MRAVADVRGGRLVIYDARTNPKGWKLSIQQWPRDVQVRVIARQLGYRVPAPNFTNPDATPARALLNHGVWRAWCPDCPFAAEDVWRGYNLFWCMRCGNLKAGRAWRPLIWPENWQQIEADLDRFPSQAQNWEPWGAAVDHVAEAEAWVAHAAVMIDPEHGLSGNEVGGADDPETYTTPVLAVTNAIIASSDANVDKGDIRYFRQFMSADPGGSGYWHQSSSTSAAGWVARATALASALAEMTSFTLLCDLTFGAIKGIIFRGNGGSTPSGIKDYAAQGLVVNVHGDSFEIYDQALANQIFQAFRSGGVSTGRIGGSGIWTAANDGAGSGLDADNLDGVTWNDGMTAAQSGGVYGLTTSYVDVAGATVTLDRAGAWLILMVGQLSVASTDGFARVQIVVNGVAQTPEATVPISSQSGVTVNTFALVSASNGHVAKLQAKKDSGSGGSTLNDSRIIAIWLAP